MAELMSSGIELMFAGMGIVFLFLTMLVVAINIMSSLVQRFFPEAPPTPVIAPPTSNSGIEKATVAAITAAIHQYRKP
ncbi:MAG: OadG family transporter subunit [Methylovulum miyakonense]|uniref:OadG family protein n=1 Tax=Methylovulum miyakonense TaxID=645578 RepID=UPI003BB63057